MKNISAILSLLAVLFLLATPVGATTVVPPGLSQGAEGTGTGALHATATAKGTDGICVEWDVNGDLVDSALGAACGSGNQGGSPIGDLYSAQYNAGGGNFGGAAVSTGGFVLTSRGVGFAPTFQQIPPVNGIPSAGTLGDLLVNTAPGSVAWWAPTYISTEVNNMVLNGVTWVNVPTANITEASVVQHEAAFAIIEGQITGTVDPTRVGADHITLLGDIAATLKQGDGAKLATTSVANPPANRCVEMDANGKLTLANAECGTVEGAPSSAEYWVSTTTGGTLPNEKLVDDLDALNTTITSSLSNTGLLTDTRFCIWNDTGQVIDCDSESSVFTPKPDPSDDHTEYKQGHVLDQNAPAWTPVEDFGRVYAKQGGDLACTDSEPDGICDDVASGWKKEGRVQVWATDDETFDFPLNTGPVRHLVEFGLLHMGGDGTVGQINENSATWAAAQTAMCDLADNTEGTGHQAGTLMLPPGTVILDVDDPNVAVQCAMRVSGGGISRGSELRFWSQLGGAKGLKIASDGVMIDNFAITCRAPFVDPNFVCVEADDGSGRISGWINNIRIQTSSRQPDGVALHIVGPNTYVINGLQTADLATSILVDGAGASGAFYIANSDLRAGSHPASFGSIIRIDKSQDVLRQMSITNTAMQGGLHGIHVDGNANASTLLISTFGSYYEQTVLSPCVDLFDGPNVPQDGIGGADALCDTDGATAVSATCVDGNSDGYCDNNTSIPITANLAIEDGDTVITSHGDFYSDGAGNYAEVLRLELQPAFQVDRFYSPRGEQTEFDYGHGVGQGECWVSNGDTIANSLDCKGRWRGNELGATAITLNSTIRVDAVLDEDNLGSDSETALATQRSIKKYIEDTSGQPGSGNAALHATTAGIGTVTSGFCAQWADDGASGLNLIDSGEACGSGPSGGITKIIADDATESTGTIVTIDGAPEVSTTFATADTLTITVQDATEAQKGVTQLANSGETNTGTIDTKAVTPKAIEAWEGSNQLIQAGDLVVKTLEAQQTTSAGALTLYEAQGNGPGKIIINAPAEIIDTDRVCTLADSAFPFDGCVTPGGTGDIVDGQNVGTGGGNTAGVFHSKSGGDTLDFRRLIGSGDVTITENTNDITIGAQVTATPEGNPTEVQYNKAGAFAGDPELTYDDLNNRLSVSNVTVAPDSVSTTGDTLFTVASDGSMVLRVDANATEPSGTTFQVIVDSASDILMDLGAGIGDLSFFKSGLEVRGTPGVVVGGDTDSGNVNIRDADGSAGVNVKSPEVVAADWTMTLPDISGDPGQLLSTNGSGETSWVPPPTTSSVGWDNITVPDDVLSLSMSTFPTDFTWSLITDQDLDAFTLAMNQASPTSANTQNLLVLRRDASGSNHSAMDAFLVLENEDDGDAITSGIIFKTNPVPAGVGGFTTAIDISEAVDIGTAIALGTNTITADGGTIEANELRQLETMDGVEITNTQWTDLSTDSFGTVKSLNDDGAGTPTTGSDLIIAGSGTVTTGSDGVNTITITGSDHATPSATADSVQYESGGTFAGNAGMTYDGTDLTLVSKVNAAIVNVGTGLEGAPTMIFGTPTTGLYFESGGIHYTKTGTDQGELSAGTGAPAAGTYWVSSTTGGTVNEKVVNDLDSLNIALNGTTIADGPHTPVPIVDDQVMYSVSGALTGHTGLTYDGLGNLTATQVHGDLLHATTGTQAIPGIRFNDANSGFYDSGTGGVGAASEVHYSHDNTPMGEVVGTIGAQTLTNKILDGTSGGTNTITIEASDVSDFAAGVAANEANNLTVGVTYETTTALGALTIGDTAVGIPLVATTATECVMLDASAIKCQTGGGGCTAGALEQEPFDIPTADFTGADGKGAWNFQLPDNFIGDDAEVSVLWTSEDIGCNTNPTVCWTVDGGSFTPGVDTYVGGSLDGTLLGNQSACSGQNLVTETLLGTFTHAMIAGERATVQIARDFDAGAAGCGSDTFSGDGKLLAVKFCYEVNNVFSGE